MNFTNHHKTIHEELTDRLAISKQLFQQFNNSMDQTPGIHQQLQQIICEHKAAMQQIYRKYNIPDSKHAALYFNQI